MRNMSGRYIRTVIVIILTVCAFFSVSAYSLVKRAVYADDLFVLCSIDYVIFPICNRAFAGITAPLTTCVLFIRMKDNLYKDNYVVRSQSRGKNIGHNYYKCVGVCSVVDSNIFCNYAVSRIRCYGMWMQLFFIKQQLCLLYRSCFR